MLKTLLNKELVNCGHDLALTPSCVKNGDTNQHTVDNLSLCQSRERQEKPSAGLVQPKGSFYSKHSKMGLILHVTSPYNIITCTIASPLIKIADSN